jgi:hypothetical protein
MKRTTLSALLFGLVLTLGLTGTSNAQFTDETSWSSSRNSSTTETWSAGFGGTTFHSQQIFGGHDAMTNTRVSPDRFQRTEMRSDFGGAWRTSNGAHFNMGQGGDWARGVNTFEGFNSNSGFRQFDGLGGSHGQQFNNSNSFGGGNAWHRGW